ncbi:uncharacterized protein LDX57_002408 [Aspergillus melleus]|uniref:uncharacterized protein n=1 Tax=Aspergillus melleus TaxID=138277 RepID=UPI001E8DBAB7|nr:uncharacterized protein LDX57_002408 [Aspergillus melleus]KAH8424664.1 hypothetical protein LDX57_002408 [Aspergillus melleus]
MSSDLLLARLPSELIVSIFGALPSFSDVAWFAATSRRHRQVWVDNAYTIYQQVAPRTIPCSKHARVLLADQGGPPVSDTHLSFQEVLQLIRNAAALEQSVAEFEKNHISRVVEYSPFKLKTRLPHLTRTERVRYIRGVYQLWGLALLGPEPRQQRVQSMKLKDLLIVRDLALGNVVHIPDPTVQAMGDGDPMAALEVICADLYPRLEQLVSDYYDEYLSSWNWPYSEGLRGSITIWDSYYGNYKDMLLDDSRGRRCPAPELVWYDTSDEEGIW